MLQSWSLGCGNRFSFYIEIYLNILFKSWNNQEAQHLTTEYVKKMETFQNKTYTLLTCPKLSRYFYFETAEIFILSYMVIVNQLSVVTPLASCGLLHSRIFWTKYKIPNKRINFLQIYLKGKDIFLKIEKRTWRLRNAVLVLIRHSNSHNMA